MNAHYSKVINTWGPPEQTHSDGNGGKILVYTKTRNFTATPDTPEAVTEINGQIDRRGNIHGTATTKIRGQAGQQGYTAYRLFYVNKDGLIYNWQWKGL